MGVLVVDDDSAIRELLLTVLEEEGYGVVGAPDGQAALEYLASAPQAPCLILLDLMMPRLDGWGFWAAQQANPAIAHIPVVALSARPDGAQQMAQLGGVRFLSKPIDLALLLSVVQNYCAL